MFFIEDPAEPAPRTDPAFLKAVAVGPDQDDDALRLLERHFELQAEIDSFEEAIAGLIAKHAGDERYKQRCLKALKARADLIGLQQRTLLTDYWPPLRRVCLPT